MGTLTEQMLLHSIFPFSEQKGRSTKGINKKKIVELAKNGKPVSKKEIEKIIENHFDFLFAGGAGGEWQTISVGDLVIGLYNIPTFIKEGEQANFERANLKKIELADREIPFANFCGVYKENGDFQNANLSYCLFTDAFLKGADFRNANLQRVDFSRANLRGANFQYANLQGADFENCDLRGADFRNTSLNETRFPGAKLEGVLHSF